MIIYMCEYLRVHLFFMEFIIVVLYKSTMFICKGLSNCIENFHDSCINVTVKKLPKLEH